MKKLIVIALLALTLPASAQLDIVVSVGNHVSGTVTNRVVTLTPKSPLPRSYGTNLFPTEPYTRKTDVNGMCWFSNTVYGNYTIDIAGNPGATFPIIVPDASGWTNAANLRGSTNSPPQDGSFYTKAQVDAIVAAVTVGAGISVAEGTGVTLSTNSGVVTISGGTLHGNGSPQGSATGKQGFTYWDTNSANLWVKTNGTGSTGWQWLIKTQVP